MAHVVVDRVESNYGSTTASVSARPKKGEQYEMFSDDSQTSGTSSEEEDAHDGNLAGGQTDSQQQSGPQGKKSGSGHWLIGGIVGGIVLVGIALTVYFLAFCEKQGNNLRGQSEGQGQGGGDDSTPTTALLKLTPEAQLTKAAQLAIGRLEGVEFGDVQQFGQYLKVCDGEWRARDEKAGKNAAVQGYSNSGYTPVICLPSIQQIDGSEVLKGWLLLSQLEVYEDPQYQKRKTYQDNAGRNHDRCLWEGQALLVQAALAKSRLAGLKRLVELTLKEDVKKDRASVPMEGGDKKVSLRSIRDENGRSWTIAEVIVTSDFSGWPIKVEYVNHRAKEGAANRRSFIRFEGDNKRPVGAFQQPITHMGHIADATLDRLGLGKWVHEFGSVAVPAGERVWQIPADGIATPLTEAQKEDAELSRFVEAQKFAAGRRIIEDW